MRYAARIGCERARAEAAEAEVARCLESENRAQAELAAAEAEVARLTRERDRYQRIANSQRGAHARVARLTAVVEAVEALADEADGSPTWHVRRASEQREDDFSLVSCAHSDDLRAALTNVSSEGARPCGCPTSGFGYRHHRHPCPRAGENEPVGVSSEDGAE